MGWRKAADTADVPETGNHLVQVEGWDILLLRCAGRIHAVEALCPHKFGPLAEGKLDGCLLTCPIHAATFDVRDGTPQPGSVWNGKLPTYPTKVEGNDVYVLVPE